MSWLIYIFHFDVAHLQSITSASHVIHYYNCHRFEKIFNVEGKL